MSGHKFKIYKGYLLRCLGLSTAILIGLQAQSKAQFISVAEPVEIYQLATPQRLTVPPIAYSELSLAVKSESVGDSADLTAPPQFNTVIIREFPGVWQMRVPVDEVDSLYATYELKADNGRTSAVSNEQRSDNAVAVVLEPLPIVEISRDLNSNTALIQGGFRLKMDLSSANFAGDYAGELTVVVDRR
ncbi:hypothetical protein CLI64_02275 [Nostoc sp. CENA543]|uniref:hypothetical protein n=1 Tax=Nostoc sp. CENA543 TaxID=1869241 RepID=UPI000CA216A2|nr:hypothetical protein [Nostoc sp. CENA543]AUS99313.1 hypothetical protein CLI64_02275 [Nostoc sp. CENA543]